ncbi:MAG: DUF192 domain-containing protein [Lentisphaeria bacterium]|nr:DUF192 domain-containing protein [Lentisphaeria bacterium]
MVILNLTRQSVLARNAKHASGFGERLNGLIGKRFSAAMDGMVFDRCNAIHTCFMKYPIDVIFADEQYRVLKTAESFPPWHPFLGCKKAYYVIELPAGSLVSTLTSAGDLLDLTGALSPETVKQWLGKKIPLLPKRETCSNETDQEQ